jgi:hypothetical protein
LIVFTFGAAAPVATMGCAETADSESRLSIFECFGRAPVLIERALLLGGVGGAGSTDRIGSRVWLGKAIGPEDCMAA